MADNIVERAAVWIRAIGGEGHGAQTRIARETGLSQPMAHKILAEGRANLTLASIARIARRRNLSIADLISEIEGTPAAAADRVDTVRRYLERPDVQGIPKSSRGRWGMARRIVLISEALPRMGYVDLITRIARAICELGPRDAMPRVVADLDRTAQAEEDTPRRRRERAEIARAFEGIK